MLAVSVPVACAARPHVIMGLVDDWGSYDASHRIRELGREPDVRTPTIDRLSAEGVTFENYYVQPICSPTRASLLSGRYSIHTGSEHRLFGANEPSCLPVSMPLMPRAFKQIGYATHMIGKWVRAHCIQHADAFS
jgi:arylsulfatase A-like enzyme